VVRVRWRIDANILGFAVEVNEEHCIIMWTKGSDMFELREHPINAIMVISDENTEQIQSRCNLIF